MSQELKYLNDLYFIRARKAKEKRYGSKQKDEEEELEDSNKNKKTKVENKIKLTDFEKSLRDNNEFMSVVSSIVNRMIRSENDNKPEDVKDCVPFMPRLGPYPVKVDVKSEFKNYHWCSCGLSKKQPFCDNSHKGTSFKPVNFQLAEKVPELMFCGCKLSKEAPFCDRQTCVKLALIEESESEKKVEKFLEFQKIKSN